MIDHSKAQKEVVSESKILESFKTLRNQTVGTPVKARKEDSVCSKPQASPACSPPSTREGPAFIVRFRAPFPFFAFDSAANEKEIACTKVVDSKLHLALDYRYEQNWCFRELVVGDLASTITLAPQERMTLTVRKTQRTTLNQKTVDSSETLKSSESSLVDKDVLNVTKSSTKTENWHIDSTGSVNFGGMSLGVSAGYSKSINETSDRSLEKISTATQKSTERLKLLQKTEVARSSEDVIDVQEKRTIVNPLPDRSLTLNVFELYKKYDTDTRLDEIRPILALEIAKLDFDHEFVLGNTELIQDFLLDRLLANELDIALEDTSATTSFGSITRVRKYAEDALRFLFEEINIFDVPLPTLPFGIAPPADLDPNDPQSSFRIFENLRGLSAFKDSLAVDHQYAKIFATLAYFNALYRDRRDERAGAGYRHGNGDQKIDLAIALSESIKEDWLAAEGDMVRHILDENNLTEIMRRLSGFIAMVEQLIKPLIKPAEEERAAQEAANRANLVIERVLKHLNCHRAYYQRTYLERIAQQTNNLAFVELLHDVLNRNPNWKELFSPTDGFLDGLQFIVPFQTRVRADQIQDVFAGFFQGLDFIGDAGGADLDESQHQSGLLLPADGVHIEAVAGICPALEGAIPPLGVKTDINISTRSEDCASREDDNVREG